MAKGRHFCAKTNDNFGMCEYKWCKTVIQMRRDPNNRFSIGKPAAASLTYYVRTTPTLGSTFESLVLANYFPVQQANGFSRFKKISINLREYHPILHSTSFKQFCLLAFSILNMLNFYFMIFLIRFTDSISS